MIYTEDIKRRIQEQEQRQERQEREPEEEQQQQEIIRREEFNVPEIDEEEIYGRPRNDRDDEDDDVPNDR